MHRLQNCGRRGTVFPTSKREIVKRDVRLIRTINAPYHRVRDLLRDDPEALFGRGEPLETTLVAHFRNTEISREVTIEIMGFDEPEGASAGAQLTFRADDARHADLFPHLEGRIDAAPVAGDRTALLLSATYKPPLGMVGGALDAVALHRVAEQSLGSFFERIVAILEG
jgi:hypothetical protein